MPIHSAFLKYFDEVQRCGSIRLAARKLYVASSAVNRQILKIEDELGIKLFERLPTGIRLTAAGRALAEHVSRTLADAERTLADIAALKQSSRSTVSIAGQESIIAHFLPPVLVEFHAEQPQVSTVFKTASGLELQEMLVLGNADIAVAFDPEADARIEETACIELGLGAVIANRHPLAHYREISLADCSPYPIVLPDHSWPLRALLDIEIEKSGLTPNIITSSNSVEFLKFMVHQQFGIGFQTIVGIETRVEKGDFLHVPLCNPRPVTQKFAICVRKDRADNPVISRVLALLASRLGDYGTPGLL